MKNVFKNTVPILLVLIMTATPMMSAYAVSESDMKSTLISVAEAEIGYEEGANHYTKYGEWYGYQGPWCTTFAIWCFNRTGEKLGVSLYGKIVPSGGNCNSMISWFSNKGRYHKRSSDYTPKKGDLVFFDWSGNGSSQHVGIVTSYSGGTLRTIEGNCSGKVKAKKYTESGKKPYANLSSVMGYGAPDWSSTTNSKPAPKTTEKKTTKKETTTAKKSSKSSKSTKKKSKKKTTTKKETTTKKQTTTKKTTTEKATEAETEKEKKTTEKTTKKKSKKNKKKKVVAKDMELHAATTELEIGDSVNLNYTIKPKGAQAVVGYFCDEENVIEIKEGGVITATGEGTATVVVCANDEIYRQCDFNVTQATTGVTQHTPETIELETTIPIQEKTLNQKLSDIGINAEKLSQHVKHFIYPAAIIGATAVLAGIIGIVKAIAAAIRKKKD